MNHVQSLMRQLDLESTRDPLEDFIQLPGLYRRWELKFTPAYYEAKEKEKAEAARMAARSAPAPETPPAS